MSIEEGVEFFAALPAIARHLKTLNEVGLGYVRLGQPAPTLSGGEAQRVKLASELQKRSTGRTLYVLDEPTTGSALRGHPQAARRAGQARRQRQHGGGDRAQPGRDQDRRLADRHGSGGRLPGWHGDRRGHAGGDRGQPALVHRASSCDRSWTAARCRSATRSRPWWTPADARVQGATKKAAEDREVGRRRRRRRPRRRRPCHGEEDSRHDDRRSRRRSPRRRSPKTAPSSRRGPSEHRSRRPPRRAANGGTTRPSARLAG